MNLRDRLLAYLEYKGIKKAAFEKAAGFSNGFVDKMGDNTRTANLDKISNFFPSLNINWLRTGIGSMESPISESAATHTGEGVPYYKEVPVSAGRAELMKVEGEENAVGFIKITGVSGKFAFPVIGCSMEPVIHAGDIVVVDELNQWDKIDPDKIYLIFTHDDRMIKHLETDEGNAEILWCVSPNYKRFSIDKTDILKIYKVTFYGRLA